MPESLLIDEPRAIAETRALSLAAERVRSEVSLASQGLSSVAITGRVRDVIACIAPWMINGDDSGATVVSSRLVKQLQDIGDIYRDGRLIFGSVPRLIHVPSSEHALVIGGVPSNDLRSRFGAEPSTFELSRFVKRADLSKSRRTDEGLWQNVLDWLGVWCRDLTGWTSETLANALTNAHDGAPLGIESADVLWYSPVSGTRWLKLTAYKGDVSGPRLCRAYDATARGGYRYFVSLLRSQGNQLQVASSVEIGRWDGVRLRFGMTALLGHQSTITATNKGTVLMLTNVPPLPTPENRILALGVLNSTSSSQRAFSFAAELEPVISFVLTSLKIQLSYSKERK